MSENATVFRGTQIAPESTKGTAVAADTRLRSTSFTLDPKIPVKGFRPQGSKAMEVATRSKEWTEGKFEGPLTYRDTVYLLSGLLETANITTPTGATLTRRWLFFPSNFAADDYVTYTIETGNSNFAERATFGLIKGLSAVWTKDDAMVSGDLLARNTVDGFSISSVTTDIDPLPVDADEISVFIGTSLTSDVWTVFVDTASGGTFTLTVTNPVTGVSATTAGIAFNALASAVKSALVATGMVLRSDDVTVTGTAPTWVITIAGRFKYLPTTITANFAALTGGGSPTITHTTTAGLVQLSRDLEARWELADRFSGVFTLDATKVSFSAEVERGFNNTAQLILEKDSAGVAFMDGLRAKTTYYCKMVMFGSDIETDWPFRISLTFPFKFGESTRGDKDDVYAITYNLIPVNDDNFAGWVEWELDTDLTAL